MKQISKAEFVRTITSRKSIFVGIVQKCDDSIISEVRKERLAAHGVNARTCVAKSHNHLIFDGESHLYLADVKPHTFVRCYKEDDGILIVEEKWLNNWEEKFECKYLYYAMVEEEN